MGEQESVWEGNGGAAWPAPSLLYMYVPGKNMRPEVVMLLTRPLCSVQRSVFMRDESCHFRERLAVIKHRHVPHDRSLNPKKS